MQEFVRPWIKRGSRQRVKICHSQAIVIIDAAAAAATSPCGGKHQGGRGEQRQHYRGTAHWATHPARQNKGVLVDSAVAA